MPVVSKPITPRVIKEPLEIKVTIDDTKTERNVQIPPTMNKPMKASHSVATLDTKYLSPMKKHTYVHEAPPAHRIGPVKTSIPKARPMSAHTGLDYGRRPPSTAATSKVYFMLTTPDHAVIP